MSAKRRVKCLVAGDANLDLLFEGVGMLQAGTEQLATGMNLVLGGSSSITAANLAALGVSTAFVGIVGNDSFGETTVNALKQAGVNTQHVLRRPGIKTGLTVWLSKQGIRSGLTYPGSIALLRANNISDDMLATAQHFHVGAYFLLKGLHRGAADLFRRAKLAGCTTSLDCNYDPSGAWNSGLKKILPMLDVFLPNEAEALKITSCNDLSTAAYSLAGMAKLVVVKCGERGALLCDGKSLRLVPAKRVKVVDTTGAGDSFNAGLLSRYISGASPLDCARFATGIAARSIRFVGGTTAFLKTNDLSKSSSNMRLPTYAKEEQ